MSYAADYVWVVICKNRRFHHKENTSYQHRIVLGEADPFSPPPALDGLFAVRCDSCAQEYSYTPTEVLRAEPYFSNPNGGALSTAGSVVFAGDSDGNFIVLDATTGHELWHVQLGAAIYSTAITFEVNHKQHVLIPAGSALFAFAVRE